MDSINATKTEFCVFHKNDTRCTNITINGIQHRTNNKMKILGIVFHTKLNWTEHVKYAIAGANKAKQAIKLIAIYFTKEELLKLWTAYFYGKLYYGSKVWLMSTLSGINKRKLWQASSRMLQIALKDYQRQLSFQNLHKMSKRASPALWSNYVTACAMYI